MEGTLNSLGLGGRAWSWCSGGVGAIVGKSGLAFLPIKCPTLRSFRCRCRGTACKSQRTGGGGRIAAAEWSRAGGGGGVEAAVKKKKEQF